MISLLRVRHKIFRWQIYAHKIKRKSLSLFISAWKKQKPILKKDWLSHFEHEYGATISLSCLVFLLRIYLYCSLAFHFLSLQDMYNGCSYVEFQISLFASGNFLGRS